MPRSFSRPGVMNKFFILRLAWRNLRSHRLRTTLTLVGIVIGVSAIVFLLSFATGLERLVTREISSGNALLLLDVDTGNSQIVNINDQVVKDIGSIGHVKHVYSLSGVAAQVTAKGSTSDVGFFGTSKNFLSLSGIRPKTGEYFDASDKPEMIINSSFIKFLGLTSPTSAVGQTVGVDITIPKELAGTLEDVKVNGVKYTITGVFEDEASPKAYSSFQSLEKLGLENFSQVKVEVDNTDSIPTVRKQIESMGLQAQYIGDTVNQINQVFLLFKAILAAFGSVTLIVSLLGMFNTLTISLLERMKEVALMKILGMRKRDISYVFLAESVLLGTIGGMLGIIVGLIIGKVVNIILNIYAVSSGANSVSLFYYPVGFILLVLAISFFVGLATGWYPAHRAIRVRPLDVLRYE